MLCLLLSTGGIPVRAQRYEDFTTRTPLEEGDVLVTSFDPLALDALLLNLPLDPRRTAR